MKQDPPAEAQDRPERVGPYRLESRLGAGGMGEVYRAWDERLERWVAIKQVLPREADNAKVRARFRREARTAAGLSHPAIVQIFDIIETEQGEWIVSEFVDGRTLQEVVAAGPLELEQALAATREIAEGLAEAHAHGIVHRDLKTENVMITQAGHAKILDFGIAKQLRPDPDETALSVEGMVLGTSRAMSPEQALGEKVDHRSDLFSFGTLLYETLTGQSPFLDSDALRTRSRICTAHQEPARELRAEVPAELSELIDHLLEKEPNHRPQSAAEVVAALTQIAARLTAGSQSGPLARVTSGIASASGPLLRALSSALTPTRGRTSGSAVLYRAVTTRPDRKGRSRRGRRRIAVRAALLLLAIAGAIYFSWRFFSASPPAAEARPAVAALGFKNLGQPPEDWLSNALPELISTELAAAENLRLISGESIARMQKELSLPASPSFTGETLARIRNHLGTDYVLVGSYVAVDQEEGQQVRVHLRLQDTSHGETIAEESVTGTVSELFDLVSQAGAVLRPSLGVGDISDRQEAAVRASLSASPEATRLYAEGLAKYRSYDWVGARDLLAEAVETDPEYALAHAALSEAWSALGYDREAQESARRAFERSEGLPREAELLIRGRYYEVASEWPQAIDAYQRLWGFFADDVEHGLRLARVQIRAGRSRDALATVESLRGLPSPARDDPRIDLVEGSAAATLSDFERQLEATERAEEKGQTQGTWILVAEARRTQGVALLSLGRPEAAVAALVKARHLFAEAGDRGKVAEVLGNLAIQLEYQGDSSGAEKLYRQALAIHRQLGNRRSISLSLNNLGDLLEQKGELATARDMLEEAAAIAHEIGDRRAEGRSTLAQVVLRQGDLATAAQLARDSLAINEEIGNRFSSAWSHFVLGQIALAAGELTDARTAYEKALEITSETGSRHLAGLVLRGLAEVRLARGELTRARKRLDESQAIFSELGEEGSLAQTHLTQARLLLERGRPAEAASLAQDAARQFEREEHLDDLAAAAAVFARALLAQGKIAEARQPVERATARAEVSESPVVRLSVAITAASLLAANQEQEEALRRIETVLGEATELGLVGVALEARLALGEVEMASGVAGSEAGRLRLEALAAEARERGFGLVARKAAAAISDGVVEDGD